MISSYETEEKEELKFQYHCKLKIEQNKLHPSCQLLAASPKRGIVFVGGIHCIKIIVSKQLLPSDINEIVESFPSCTISLPESPYHIDVNSNEKYLAVICNVQDCPVLYLYDMDKFFTKESPLVQEIRVSSSSNTRVLQLTWNPCVPNMIAYCLSDGSAGIYTLLKLGETFEINTLPPVSNSTCLCWSPKGKQIVVGTKHGVLIQYKIELKAVKEIPAPELSSEGILSVTNVKWLSTFQYLASYRNLNDNESTPNVMVVDVPKNQPMRYTNFEDVCQIQKCPSDDRYYFIHQPIWNIIIVVSSSGEDVRALILDEDNSSWKLLLPNELYSIEIPYDDNFNAYSPIGVAIDYSLTDEIPTEGDEGHTFPPMPSLWILLNNGHILRYRVINEGHPAQICFPPEIPLSDCILKTFFMENLSEDVDANFNDTASNSSSFEELEYLSDDTHDQNDHFEIVELPNHDEQETNYNEEEKNFSQNDVNYVEIVENNVEQEDQIWKVTETEDNKNENDDVKNFEKTADVPNVSPVGKKIFFNGPCDLILNEKKYVKEFIDMVLHAKFKKGSEDIFSSIDGFDYNKHLDEWSPDVHYQDKIKNVILDTLENVVYLIKDASELEKTERSNAHEYISDSLGCLSDFFDKLNDTIVSLDADVNELSGHLLKLFERFEYAKRIYRTRRNERFDIITNSELKSICDDTIKDLEQQMQSLDICANQLNKSLDEIVIEPDHVKQLKYKNVRLVYSILSDQMKCANTQCKRLEMLESRIRKADKRNLHGPQHSFNSLHLNELKSRNDGYGRVLENIVKSNRLTDLSSINVESNAKNLNDPTRSRSFYKFDRRKIRALEDYFGRRGFYMGLDYDSAIKTVYDKDDIRSSEHNDELVRNSNHNNYNNNNNKVSTEDDDIDYLSKKLDKLLLIEENLRKTPISRLIVEYIRQSAKTTDGKNHEQEKKLNALIQHALLSLENNKITATTTTTITNTSNTNATVMVCGKSTDDKVKQSSKNTDDTKSAASTKELLLVSSSEPAVSVINVNQTVKPTKSTTSALGSNSSVVASSSTWKSGANTLFLPPIPTTTSSYLQAGVIATPNTNTNTFNNNKKNAKSTVSSTFGVSSSSNYFSFVSPISAALSTSRTSVVSSSAPLDLTSFKKTTSSNDNRPASTIAYSITSSSVNILSPSSIFSGTKLLSNPTTTTTYTISTLGRATTTTTTTTTTTAAAATVVAAAADTSGEDIGGTKSLSSSQYPSFVLSNLPKSLVSTITTMNTSDTISATTDIANITTVASTIHTLTTTSTKSTTSWLFDMTTTTNAVTVASTTSSSLFEKPLFGNSLTFGDKKFNDVSIFSGIQSTTKTATSNNSIFGATAAFAGFGVSSSSTTSSLLSTSATNITPPNIITTSVARDSDTVKHEAFTTASTTTATTVSNTSFFGSIPTGSIFSGTASTAKNNASIFGGGNVSFGTSIFSGTSQSGPATQTSSASPEINKNTLFSTPLFGTGSSSFQGANTATSTFQNGISGFGEGKSIFGNVGSTAVNTSSPATFGTSTFSSAETTGFFSQAPKAGQSIFGLSSTFGSTNSFGAQPTFGKSATFGNAPAFGSAPSFGSSPSFGTSNNFGSPGKVFGQTNPTGAFGSGGQQSSTFENLASGNTISFGNLAAQQSPQSTFGSSNFGTKSQPPVESKPAFGGNSFSSWR